MSAGNYLSLPTLEALRWFKVLAVYRCASSGGEDPGFDLPPGRLPVRLNTPDEAHTILVIDDQPLLREALGEYLTLQGYDVKLADCGCSAMQLVEAGLQPDLILCDVMLPDIDGGSLAREAQLLLPDVRWLFISGYAEEAVAARIRGQEFLQKPFRLDVLASRVRSLFARAPRH